MNKLSGISTLNAGAPDLRLSGDQTQRGTYTQRRRTQMAGGGIMGSNAGSMLVAPTADGSRPGYGWLDTIMDVGKKIGQTIVPGGETGYINLYGGQPLQAHIPEKNWDEQMRKGPEAPLFEMPQGSPGEINPYTEPFPTPTDYKNVFDTGAIWRTPGYTGPIDDTTFPTSDNWVKDIFGSPVTNTVNKVLNKKTGDPFELGKDLEENNYGQGIITPKDPQDPWYQKLLQTILPGGETGYIDLYSGTGKEGEDPSIFRQAANIAVPLGIGKWAHDYQRDWLKDQPKFQEPPGYAGGVSGIQKLARITPEAEAAAKGLFFTPQDKYRLRSPEQEQAILGAADGGRIGYNRGRVVNPGGYAGELTGSELFLKLYQEGKIDNLQQAMEDANRYDAGETTNYEKHTGNNPLDMYQKYSDPSEVSLGSGLAEEAKQTIQSKEDELQQGLIESGVLDDLDLRAQGGRIGYAEAGDVLPEAPMSKEEMEERAMGSMYDEENPMTRSELKKFMERQRQKRLLELLKRKRNTMTQYSGLKE